MSNVRIERMVRELRSEPTTQFFEALLALAFPGRKAARIEAVAPDRVAGTLVAQRAQRRDDDRVAVHFEKAA